MEINENDWWDINEEPSVVGQIWLPVTCIGFIVLGLYIVSQIN